MNHSPPPAHARLARVYDACLELADWCAGRPRLMLVGAVPAFIAFAAAVGWLVLQHFPNSGDEYAYLYQAQTFAQGRLSNDGLSLPTFFRFNYIAQENGREYSSFPLGWPLLLAGALRLHVPAWLVNPILGGLSLVLVAVLGARLHTPRIGVLAAGIVAVSGFFVFNAASYFSHTFCGALLLLAACLAARRGPLPSWVPLAVGFCLGWAVLARYFTAVVCAVPILVLLVRGVPDAEGRREVRRAAPLLAFCALGGLPWIAVLAAYNLALTGSPWQLTTMPATVSLWFAPRFALRGADMLASHLLRFVAWTPPLLLFVYVFHLARGARHLRRGLIDWLPVIMAAALYAYVERGGNQYGPRFFYETFPFLVIFTTANLFGAARFTDKTAGERRAFALMAASVAVMPLSLAAHAAVEHRVIAERRDPYRTVAAAGIDDALVLIHGRVGTTRSMGPLDLTRNGIAHQGEVLYGLDLGSIVCRLRAVHPQRDLYRYRWDAVGRRGRLEPIRCGAGSR